MNWWMINELMNDQWMINELMNDQWINEWSMKNQWIDYWKADVKFCSIEASQWKWFIYVLV